MRPKTPPKTPPHLVRNRRINQFVSPETNRAMRLPNDEFYRNMQKDLLNDFPDFIGPIQKCIENFYYVIYQRDKFDGDHSILSTLLREIESATGIKGKNHHTKAAQQFNIINSTLANLSELLKASKQYADIPEFYLNYLSALNKKLLNSLRKISTDKKLEIIASNGLDVDSPEYSVDLTQEEKLALEQSNPTP
ncbi:MAG: hypothetical protein KDH94_02395, partial [Coxiellaceae bacterium]|nr:hypothetical protein [Coxiellaceae bacterium]